MLLAACNDCNTDTERYVFIGFVYDNVVQLPCSKNLACKVVGYCACHLCINQLLSHILLLIAMLTVVGENLAEPNIQAARV